MNKTVPYMNTITTNDTKTAIHKNSPFYQPPNLEYRNLLNGVVHHFYLYGEIGDPIDYVDIIHVLDTAHESDHVHLHLNTEGGQLTTAITLIHAMRRTKALITTHADGEVSSAGTILFLSGHMMAVYDYSHFMFHDGSGGMITKLNEAAKYIEATQKLLKKITIDIYSKVFSDQEIEDINRGIDRYMDSDEMYDRLLEYSQTLEQEEDDK